MTGKMDAEETKRMCSLTHRENVPDETNELVEDSWMEILS